MASIGTVVGPALTCTTITYTSDPAGTTPVVYKAWYQDNCMFQYTAADALQPTLTDGSPWFTFWTTAANAQAVAYEQPSGATLNFVRGTGTDINKWTSNAVPPTELAFDAGCAEATYKATLDWCD